MGFLWRVHGILTFLSLLWETFHQLRPRSSSQATDAYGDLIASSVSSGFWPALGSSLRSAYLERIHPQALSRRSEGQTHLAGRTTGFDSRGVSTDRVSVFGDPVSLRSGLQIHPAWQRECRPQTSEQTALGENSEPGVFSTYSF